MAGEQPDGWSEGKSRFFATNHISVALKHKLIRKFHLTNAEVHESLVVGELLDDNNTSRELWADSAYRSRERVAWLRAHRYRERLQRKGSCHHPLSGLGQQGNRTRSRSRSRIEHVLGVQSQRAGSLAVCRALAC